MTKWTPMDGDTFLTKENFVFYVFGYEHPQKRVFSFLKYIPQKLKNLFLIRFLERKWKLGNTVLVRPEKLYSAKNFQTMMKTFRTNFPHYIYFCPFHGKEIFSSPIGSIKHIYVPKECLQELLAKKKKDPLQELAVELAELLSKEYKISIDDFGIRGSIALNMHSGRSDIDLAIYGSQNFRKLEKTIDKLENENVLRHIFSTNLDRLRKHRGRYKGTVFMVNAVRKIEEITTAYGDYRYIPVKPVTFSCEVIDDTEAMFRPAIYQIKDYKPSDSISELADNEIPKAVVSMIGCYRNVARKGSKFTVSGTLEKVENTKNGKIYHQVVIGTGKQEDEYLWPT
jgi:predicted nucleotidyltransferase